jgi:hypothetical protein
MDSQDYVLIVFESVQPKNLKPLRATHHLVLRMHIVPERLRYWSNADSAWHAG